jgi:type I restriction enzyme R subunit
MNEAETRAEHIDPALRAAGWGVVEGSRILREKQCEISPGRLLGGGQRAKAEIADYVLVYRNTKLATIEAKAWDKPYTEGVAQAKRYASKLAVRFAYASNGQKIYSIDMATGTEADVPHYPSPEALWAQTFDASDAASADWRIRFAAVPFEDKGGSWSLRYYQEIAVNRVLQCVAAGQQRLLLTLATGTGKTSIAFQIVWKLYKARWSLSGQVTRQPRVLFLADRNNLANQAFNDFNGFAAFNERDLVRISPDAISKAGKVPKNGAVFFTIFQTFMSGADQDGVPAPYFGEYPPDYFDLIVVDECHRGGAQDEGNWRAILDYFAPAVQLGLTATPKRSSNADTYAYFGDPVHMYSLKEGINDGFLTPFKVKQIATTLDDYTYTPDDAVVAGEVVTGRRYGEGDFNRVIVIAEREAYRVKLLMGMIDQRDKTIVFCATQAHALTVRDLINQCKTSTDPMYCVRVTADDGAQGDEWLRSFQDNEHTIPTILTTSQKLSTGVDARNVRNIVLMRPVGSMIEFKQIIGRGTRLFEGKDYFTIYDFVRAHHHFSDPEWDGEPIAPEPHAPGTKTHEVRAPEADYKPELPKTAVKLEVKLADGKVRLIQSMTATTFWSAEGTPMSAAQFMESLFGVLPEFFKDEDALRTLWRAPDTRRALLAGLADKGFGKQPLKEMQRAIEADHSDLFDVLAYVAFLAPPETRAYRAEQARVEAHQHFNDRQQAFIDFVLAQYVSQGVDELDADKLTPLLRLKYNNAISDAVADLGSTAQIRTLFAGFQKYLYPAEGKRV